MGDAVEASRGMAKPLTIALREGVHFISSPVQLGPEDSGKKPAALVPAFATSCEAGLFCPRLRQAIS